MQSNDGNNKLEELLRKMYAEETLYEESTGTDMIDEEWAKFETAHFHSSLLLQAKQLLRLHQIAAMLIGVLVLSGIAYAAVRIVSQRGGEELQSPAQEVRVSKRDQQKTVGQPIDSTAMQSVVFENAELEEVIGLPAGVTLNATRDTISGTPVWSAVDPMVYNYEVRVTSNQTSDAGSVCGHDTLRGTITLKDTVFLTWTVCTSPSIITCAVKRLLRRTNDPVTVFPYKISAC